MAAPQARKVWTYIPESRMMSELQDLETQIDVAIATRQTQMLYTAAESMPKYLNLRIFLWHSTRNQPRTRRPAGAADGGAGPPDSSSAWDSPAVLSGALPAERDGDPPSWTLHIHGKLFSEEVVKIESRIPDARSPTGFKRLESHEIREQEVQGTALSALVRRMEIKITALDDPNAPPFVVSWDKSLHGMSLVEGFEVRRAGSFPVKATVTVDVESTPELFEVDEDLQAVIGLQECTKGQAIHAVWKYIHAHNLQDANVPMRMTPDDTLRRLFGDNLTQLHQVGERVDAHLRPLPPVTLEHTIDPVASTTGTVDVFNIRVMQPTMAPQGDFVRQAAPDRGRLGEISGPLTDVVSRLDERRRARALLHGFSESPVDFITQMLVLQGQDVRYHLGAAPTQRGTLARAFTRRGLHGRP